MMMFAVQADADDRTDPAAIRDRLGQWEIAPLAETIRREGIACIPAYFDHAEVEQASAEIDHLRADAAPACDATPRDQGEMLSRHFSSPAVHRLCRTICEHLDRQYRGAEDCKQVLRYLSSESPQQHFYYFHFDSYRLTIIAPIRMPASERKGDLLIFPNLRRVPTSYLLNIFDKALYDTRWMQAFRKRQALRGGTARRIPMTPGNIYLIDGSRTLHANADIDPGEVRVTLVFHFAETHRDHWLRVLRRRRLFRR